MPPGLVIATWAPALRVAASWASAITSPSGDSPDGPAARPRSRVIEPTGRPATGAAFWTASDTSAAVAGSGATSRLTTSLRAVLRSRTTSPFSTVTSTTESSRPNDRPWTTGRGRPSGSGYKDKYYVLVVLLP